MSLAIPVALLIFNIVLLWILVTLKGKNTFKFVIILAAQAVVITVYYALSSFLGWPTTEATPQKFVIEHVIIKEPSKRGTDDGAIWILIRNFEEDAGDNVVSVLGYEAEPGTPRSHQMPYTRERHKAMHKVQGLLKKGKTVTGQRKGGGGGEWGVGKKGQGKGNGKGKGGNGKQGQGRGGGSISVGQDEEFIYHTIPPSKIIRKELEPNR